MLACIVRAVGTPSVLVGLFREELDAAVGVEVEAEDAVGVADVTETVKSSAEGDLEPDPPVGKSETLELILESVTTSILFMSS
jgi:hypothetical protein